MSTFSKPTVKPATLLSSHTYQHPNKLLISELFFNVPLDHTKPDGRQLRLFCRTAEPYENSVAPSDKEEKTKKKHLPLLAYIQGGPGFGISHPANSSSTEILLSKGYKLVCLDHRGMGMSNTITASTLRKEADAKAQAEYLTYFRAPCAVSDLEAVRLCLTAEYPENARKWSIMGQSYGGWVSTNYLSTYPQGLRESFIFGGLPPIHEKNPEANTRRLMTKLKERNDVYYTKFPEDVSRVRIIVDHLKSHPPILPDGSTLTAARFLEQGIGFGMSGGIVDVHDKVLRAANDLDLFGELTRPTLDALSNPSSFDTAILYAFMHEAIYCQGEASNWTFDRVVADHPEFDHRGDQTKQKYLFTGEMVFPRCFDEYSELHDLKPVAEILHAKTDWPALYDVEQLRNKNEVPVYAAVYAEDMYVSMESSLATAGMIKGCKVYLTNQMYHNAIRAKTREVLDGLFGLRDDCLD